MIDALVPPEEVTEEPGRLPADWTLDHQVRPPGEKTLQLLPPPHPGRVSLCWDRDVVAFTQ